MASFLNKTFAVVDLETTGTQHEDNNHIIQFGCAIIKNLKVVKTYSFMINPHCDIPLAVQNLTHIHNEDVKKEKDFTYYAPKIIKILRGTIFVAHNVNFDLPFLNYELVQHGFEALTNKAIDTVELAKIAFPTLPSYKLSDLTTQLEIKHINPHKADSDAYSTAILLIRIIHKLETLPQATLNTLSSLAHGLIRETSWIFSTIADDSRKNKRPLDKQYQQVRNIILQKQTILEANQPQTSNETFPLSNKTKREMFKGKIFYRISQVKLINRLNQFIQNPHERALLVEAPNGTGKTFSYLFAYAYRLYSNRKLIVATPTKILQNQIISQEIPQLLNVTKLDLKAEVVKSSSHYLDLDGFYQSLYQNTPNKLTLVMQMRILVWLTKTKTGDLDELQLTSYQAPLFTQITHPGDARVGSNFADVDFWNLARHRQEEADILITNHAYLANHYNDSIWGQNPYLVIDEAHRFVDNVVSSRNDSFQFESLWGELNHLRNLLYYADDSVFNQYGNDVQFNFILEKLNPQILELIEIINQLQRLLTAKSEKAVNKNILANGNLLLSFQAQDLFMQNNKFKTKLAEFQRKLESIRQQTNQVLFKLYSETDNSGTEKDALLSELNTQIDLLDNYISQSYQLSDLLHKENILQQEGFIVTLTNPQDPLSANLSWIMLDASNELKQIYNRFSHICFVSATLTSENNFDFSVKRLALSDLRIQKYIGRSTFDLKKHLEVLAVTDMPELTNPFYEKTLSQILENDLSKKQHVLVLMTNLDKISEIYSTILNSPSLRDFEILAQGITGSNNRIIKRFTIAQKAIILGADSFWEGIDFHECSIDLVIVAKLPFESPDQPNVKLRQKLLYQQGINVFQNDTMPRAIIRFRQGMGRLIRNEKDNGQFLILDSRIWQKDYGKDFLKTIPVNTQKICLSELQSKLDNYDKR
ncbi:MULTISPECIES: helicase C-terminal domain-containing protein [unclassified Lactobacillus]|uniref:helicase C-terminal domain-containing protein n=1 Tax=unclassified Lactobacillus TaxID=2620435 RepID=UPI000EFD68D7|nr:MULTISPECIES: helicase C-terminal domain-containing protein [unclassified Lactobacillus]RMC24641.1 ATP-dependent DNA helicase [Lactobacillus sp. ESL0247]RMC28913.1 ATP-dependent DNA helicase [Lactobacillus sp. ESL0246]RMC32158.1 ATP-dependent DNA helicase [Lactobacillus sp. ESL0245]